MATLCIHCTSKTAYCTEAITHHTRTNKNALYQSLRKSKIIIIPVCTDADTHVSSVHKETLNIDFPPVSSTLLADLQIRLRIRKLFNIFFKQTYVVCTQMNPFNKMVPLSSTQNSCLNETLYSLSRHMGLDVRKPVFGDLRITQVQTSLRIHAV